jgi:FAD dependent oxidoreductase TIGR03364
MTEQYDIGIVGGGILGLAHALAAAKRGLKTILFDRDQRANGASIRNFGFVTVTGQQAGDTWRRAQLSRRIWGEIVGPAGIQVLHQGTYIAAHRPEALAVLQSFQAGEMGQGCTLLGPADLAARAPVLRSDAVLGALHSPHELRVEPREAIPLIARYLEQAHGVTIRRGVHVKGVAAPHIETTSGTVLAERVIVCPGDDYPTLYPEIVARHGLTRCKLHMMRLAPQGPGWTLPGSIMSDLTLVRYEGFADCAGLPALRRRLEDELPTALRHGVHLIAVQSADGSLVVGDSHHYDLTPDPFWQAEVEQAMLEQAEAALRLASSAVVERWLGTYASSAQGPCLIEAPDTQTRLVIVTSGTGMSTGFGIAEEVLAAWG